MRKKSFVNIATSKEALHTRIQANKNAEKDFDEWSINLFPKINFGTSILDLGCGTGKQINLFAEFLEPDTAIYALDVSSESLNALKNTYCALPKLKLINDSFENFPNYINAQEGFFDLVYSFYALYYTVNLKNAVSLIYKHLKGNGIFWIVAPYKGTNEEIFDILKRFYNIDQRAIYSINAFYKDIIILSEKIGFRNIKINLLKNKINFINIKELIYYLRNTTFYNKNHEDDIVKEFKKEFQKSKVFTVSKNAISIMLEK